MQRSTPPRVLSDSSVAVSNSCRGARSRRRPRTGPRCSPGRSRSRGPARAAPPRWPTPARSLDGRRLMYRSSSARSRSSRPRSSMPGGTDGLPTAPSRIASAVRSSSSTPSGSTSPVRRSVPRAERARPPARPPKPRRAATASTQCPRHRGDLGADPVAGHVGDGVALRGPPCQAPSPSTGAPASSSSAAAGCRSARSDWSAAAARSRSKFGRPFVVLLDPLAGELAGLDVGEQLVHRLRGSASPITRGPRVRSPYSAVSLTE